MTLRWWYIKIIIIDKSVVKNKKKWFPNLFQMTPRTGKTGSWRLAARRSLRTKPTRTTQNTWQVEFQKQKSVFVCFFFFSKIRAQAWSFNFGFRKENPRGGNPGPRPIRSQTIGRLCSVSCCYCWCRLCSVSEISIFLHLIDAQCCAHFEKKMKFECDCYLIG